MFFHSLKVVTREHPFRKHNRRTVLDAVTSLVNATPKQVLQYIQGQEKVRVNRDNRYLTFSDEEKEEIVKKRTMTDRTVVSCLNELTRLGVTVNINNKGMYSLHDRVRAEYRYFGDRFSRLALHIVMNDQYPGTYTLKENTEALVSGFGTYVVYCLIEAIRSFDLLDGEMRTDENVDKRISAWLEDVFDPLTMLIYFVSALKDQPTDKEVMQYRKSLGQKKIKEIGFSSLPFTDSDQERPIIFSLDNPKYALKQETILKILGILETTHPKYLKHMKLVKERLLLELNQGADVDQQR